MNELDSLTAPSGLFSPTYEPLNWKLSVRYFENDGKWNLKYISYSGDGKNYLLNTALNFDHTFVTTFIQKDQAKPIPFDERFGRYGNYSESKGLTEFRIFFKNMP